MLSKQKLSLIRSLHVKKYSYEHRLFVIEGEKLLKEAILSAQNLLEEVFILHEDLSKWENELHNLGIQAHGVNNKELDQLSNLATPPPVIAICRHFKDEYNPDLFLNKPSLYLHDIRDPGNMGTIIRTADWFGISTILCSETCVDIYNTKLIQSTMGSIFRIKLFYIGLDQLTSLKENIPLYASTLGGANLYNETKLDKGIIMMGSESHGIPEEILNLADKRITIPKAPNGKAESLNVALATGIILSHLIK